MVELFKSIANSNFIELTICRVFSDLVTYNHAWIACCSSNFTNRLRLKLLIFRSWSWMWNFGCPEYVKKKKQLIAECYRLCNFSWMSLNSFSLFHCNLLLCTSWGQKHACVKVHLGCHLMGSCHKCKKKSPSLTFSQGIDKNWRIDGWHFQNSFA